MSFIAFFIAQVLSPFVLTLNIDLRSKYSGASNVIYDRDINTTFFEKIHKHINYYLDLLGMSIRNDYGILDSIDTFLWLIIVQEIFYPS